MRLLLDTHALIWALEGNKKLSAVARAAMRDPANAVLVSAVSAWEIVIKMGLKRLEVPADLVEAIDDAGFTRRSLGFPEAKRLSSLPYHHHDPFDRMLIAHALEEGASLVTQDGQIAKYNVAIVW